MPSCTLPGARAERARPAQKESPLRRLTILAFILGLAAVAVLVAWQGFGAVATALADLGWGILLMMPFYALFLALGTASWRMVFVSGRAPDFWPAALAIWIGASVNVLLPVATIGGEVAKARVLTRFGIQGLEAGGSVVVDTTVQALSLVLWGMVGLVVLLGVSTGTEVPVAALAVLVVFAIGIAAFIGLQRAGMFGHLARIVGGLVPALAFDGAMRGAAGLDANVRALYAQPWRVIGATALRLLARVAMVGEVWVAAAMMGQAITVWDAVMLKSLSMALRGIAFVVPGGLGVQEGAFIVIGTIVGLPAELTLALSLATRAREILSSIPALLVWRRLEGATLAALLSRRGESPER